MGLYQFEDYSFSEPISQCMFYSTFIKSQGFPKGIQILTEAGRTGFLNDHNGHELKVN